MEKTTDFGFENIAPHLKAGRVHQVFQSVANHYDIMNDVMSLGLHRLWKRICIARSQIQSTDQVLDLAAGTGDLSTLALDKLGDQGNLVSSDINNAMLSRARDRIQNQGKFKNIQYILANAEILPFPNNYFDRILMGFGLRNVTYKEKALSEMFRVLKPGGRVVILEFSKFQSTRWAALYEYYSLQWLPKLGKMIAQDADSYQYLAESIRRHPDQETLKTMMETACFEEVQFQNIHQGLVALHIGLKF